MPKIFISYRRADSAMLATLMQVKLKSLGIDAFVDTRNIDGGGLFPNRLRRAIENADVFVCLLGATTLDSEWVCEEIEHAHRINKTLIPIFQERYKSPDPLPKNGSIYTLLQSDGIHVFDVKNVYIDAAMSNLANMIAESPRSKFTLPDFEWVRIPTGKVTLVGSSDGYIRGNSTVSFHVDSFTMTKYPITNFQYSGYVKATGRKPRFWYNPNFNQKLQPVVGISWENAIQYCNWLSSHLDYSVTLPTEQQWQRAAQGDDNRHYPWGNQWEEERCNAKKVVGTTTVVNQYQKGVSPYGVMDMAGNVWEWCLTAWETGSQKVDEFNVNRVLRGGSWLSNVANVRVTSRFNNLPNHWYDSYGFRIVRSHS